MARHGDTPVQHRDRRLVSVPNGRPRRGQPVRSAGRLVERVLVLGQVVLGDRHEARCRSSAWWACRSARRRPAATPCAPMSAGFWAISACTTPVLEVLDLLRAGVEADDLDLLGLAGLATPVAAPSAENRLVAKMPLRSGFLASIGLDDRRRLGRVVVVVLQAEVRRGRRAFAPVLEALARAASVVEMPGLTLTTKTLPVPPISLASVLAAASPPPSLSEAICETAMSGWSSVVSTSTTFEPPSASCLIGAYIAFVSVGAISIASGFLAATALTIGVCRAASNLSGPWKSSVDAELLGLGLGPAVHRDVELVALDAGDQRHLVLLAAAALALELEPPSAVVVAAAGGEHSAAASGRVSSPQRSATGLRLL